MRLKETREREKHLAAPGDTLLPLFNSVDKLFIQEYKHVESSNQIIYKFMLGGLFFYCYPPAPTPTAPTVITAKMHSALFAKSVVFPVKGENILLLFFFF